MGLKRLMFSCNSISSILVRAALRSALRHSYNADTLEYRQPELLELGFRSVVAAGLVRAEPWTDE